MLCPQERQLEEQATNADDDKHAESGRVSKLVVQASGYQFVMHNKTANIMQMISQKAASRFTSSSCIVTCVAGTVLPTQ